MTENEITPIQDCIENGEVLSIRGEMLAVEVRRLKMVIQSNQNLSETQDIIQQLCDAECLLAKALDQWNVHLISLHKIEGSTSYPNKTSEI